MNIFKSAAAKILIFVLMHSLPAKAETYYIDRKNGNDSHIGLSEKTAWKTLTNVNALVLQPGDAIRFRSGTRYDGQLKISGKGSAAKNIVFGAYGKGEKPRIDGNGAFNETVLLYNSEYITLENLEITNTGAKPEAGRKGLHIVLNNFGIAHNIHINNLYIHDVNGSNVKKAGGGAGIHWTNGGREVKSAFDGLLIENCLIERTDRNGITSSGYWSRKDWFPSRKVIIRNNRINDIGGDGIVPIGCVGALIEHNVLYKAGQRFPEGDAAAGIWPWSCDSTLIQYNEVAYTAGPWDSQGFDADWNCRNTIIQYNYSHHNLGGFLLVCDDGSSVYPTIIGNTGTIVRYNVSYQDGGRKTGIHAGFSPIIHITGPVKNTQIYNNIIYLPERESAATDSTLIEMGNWHGYADSTLIANNIFYVKGVADFVIAKSTRNFYQSNVYYGKQLNIPSTPGAIKADPQFKATPAAAMAGFENLKNFMLKGTSKAIGAGVPVIRSAIKDFFGNPVLPGLHPTIGIHEMK
ncbi:MAG: right-handed parallel beta-helix repeat-containing protein [Sphingobacteriaceae bacterium]